ncbi:MAG: binding domain protein excisionase family [Nocardioides sp.]|nr:binding domain protein excisionase family [Nocardioides sp.]
MARSVATRTLVSAFGGRTNLDSREPTLTEYLHRDPTLRDELLTIEEVAELIRMPVASLRYWRVLGTGPLGFIIGRRLRYWRQDVMDWLDEQRESTGRGVA